jgi:hypothetical protein
MLLISSCISEAERCAVLLDDSPGPTARRLPFDHDASPIANLIEGTSVSLSLLYSG